MGQGSRALGTETLGTEALGTEALGAEVRGIRTPASGRMPAAGNSRKKALAALFMMTTAIVAGVAATDRAAIAQAAQTSFDVPSGPLGRALTTFGRQAGLQVTYLAATTAGKTSPGVSGPATREQALERILHGTGLVYRFTNATTVAVSQPSADAGNVAPDGSIVLGVIDVQARAESAWGPANGFVATRSATGTKTDTPLIETPQTINVVTRDEITTRGPRTLAEVLRYTPGVVTEVQPGTTYFDRIRVRGFYNVDNFYLDGIQLTPKGTGAVAQIDPFHLERVEVLKGPASVLYGQNGTGGLINMISKRPQAEPHREIGFGVGNNDFRQASFDIGGPATKDGKFLYRVSGIGRKSDTDIDFTSVERWSIAPSLTWKPTDVTSLTLLAGYQHDPDGSSGAYQPITGTVLPNRNGRIPRNLFTSDPTYNTYDREQAYVASIFQHRFNDALEFRQTARMMHVDVAYTPLRLGALQADQRTASRTAEDSHATTNGFNIDNNLLYRFSLGEVDNQFLAGFDYRYFRSRNYSASGTNASLRFDLFAPVYGRITVPPLTVRTNNTVSLEQYGLYAQNTFSWGNWRLVTGLRQDWANRDQDDFRTGAQTSERDSALTGRAGLVYLFDNGFAPYVSYSTSFEPTSGTDYFGGALKPTEGQQWEAGLRYQPPGFNGAFTLSAYELTRRNVTTADNLHSCANAPLLPDCGSYSVQTGEVRVRGVEFEGKVSLTERIDASVAYTYMDAEVTESNDGDLGKRPTNTPMHMASGWLSYHFGDGWLRGLTIGAGTRFVGGMYADGDNRNRIKSYTLVDAMLNYDLKALAPQLDGASVQINATNIADRKAVGGCWSESYCDYVAGRSVIGSLRVRF